MGMGLGEKAAINERFAALEAQLSAAQARIAALEVQFKQEQKRGPGRPPKEKVDGNSSAD